MTPDLYFLYGDQLPFFFFLIRLLLIRIQIFDKAIWTVFYEE